MENVSDDDEDNEDFEKRAEHVPEISARGICSGNDSGDNYWLFWCHSYEFDCLQKQVEKQSRQQVVMIIVHKFNQLKGVDLVNV